MMNPFKLKLITVAIMLTFSTAGNLAYAVDDEVDPPQVPEEPETLPGGTEPAEEEPALGVLEGVFLTDDDRQLSFTTDDEDGTVKVMEILDSESEVGVSWEGTYDAETGVLKLEQNDGEGDSKIEATLDAENKQKLVGSYICSGLFCLFPTNFTATFNQALTDEANTPPTVDDSDREEADAAKGDADEEYAEYDDPTQEDLDEAYEEAPDEAEQDDAQVDGETAVTNVSNAENHDQGYNQAMSSVDNADEDDKAAGDNQLATAKTGSQSGSLDNATSSAGGNSDDKQASENMTTSTSNTSAKGSASSSAGGGEKEEGYVTAQESSTSRSASTSASVDSAGGSEDDKQAVTDVQCQASGKC